MLSGVLKSPRAVRMNIEIMRAFVRMRRIIAVHKDLARKLQELESRFETHDEQIQSLFDAIRQLMTPPEPKLPPRRRIGFTAREKASKYLV